MLSYRAPLEVETGNSPSASVIWLHGLGANGLAARYKAWFKRMQVHFHMYSPDELERRAKAVGFCVEQ